MRVLLTWQAVIHFRIIVVFAQSNLSGLDVVTPSVMAQLPLPGVGGVGPCQDQLELYIVSSGGFIYIYIYTYTLPPTIMVQWKMAVLPMVSFPLISGTFPLNHDFGRKGNSVSR